MKINFITEYKSIKKFVDIDIESDLVIFTGVNGSGKTHFLEAIKNKAIEVFFFKEEGVSISSRLIGADRVLYFNFSNFLIEDQHPYRLSEYKDLINNILLCIESRKPYFSEFDQSIKSCFRENVEINSFYKADIEALNPELLEDYKKYTDEVSNRLENYKKYTDEAYNSIKNNMYLSVSPEKDPSPSILKYIFSKTNKPLSEINYEDLIKYNIDYVEYSLSKNLTEIFLNYQRKIVLSELSKEQGGYGFSNEEILDLKQKSPLNIINGIFEDFELEHRITCSEFNAKSFMDTNQYFSLNLVIDNLNLRFSEVSSGERALIALVITLFQEDNYMPDLLLLDEIDAHIHPSKIEKTLRVIKKVFISKGVKVIMTTHSPTTIAQADKDSIYEIKKGDIKDKIVKIDKNKALDILSNGLVSIMEENNNTLLSYISDNNNLLFVEGCTDRIILKNAWSKLYSEEKCPFYIQEVWGCKFLSNFFNNYLITNEALEELGEKIVFGLFDFDEAGYNDWNNLWKGKYDIIEDDPAKCLIKKYKNKNIYAMLLPVPESIKKQVIRSDGKTKLDTSLLCTELLFFGIKDNINNSNFRKEEFTGGGEVIKFNGDKVKFAKSTRDLDKEYFKNFKIIFEKIKLISEKSKFKVK